MNEKILSALSRYAHPLLMILYPISQFYAHNITELRPTVLYRPLLVSLAITFLAWILLSLIPRVRPKATLLLTLSWFFFFSYSHIVGTFFPGNIPVAAELGYALLYLVLVFLLLGARSDLKKLHTPCTVILLVLALIPLGRIVLYRLQSKVYSIDDIAQAAAFPPELKASLENPAPDIDKPDIYYLIFDRYASANTLKQYLNFDNSEFERKLQEQGFYIASRSMTNYPYTFLSLASSLNARYLDEVAKFKDSKDRTYAYRLIGEALVPRYLKAQGYRYIHIGSWWEATRTNRYADRVFFYNPVILENWNLNEFEFKLLETTWFDLIIRQLEAGLSREKSANTFALDAQKPLNQIRAVLDSAREPGPKFVFCHFLLTHPPYYFKADGSLNPSEKRDVTTDPRLYLDSVRFTNQQILDMIQTIDRNSPHKPVIIIQADEGPYSHLIKPNSQWKNHYTRTRMRTQILNALRLPAAGQDRLYPTISPVNTFRLLFNTLFKTNLPLLDDQTLLIIKNSDIYTFTNDTLYLRQNEEYFASQPLDE